MYKKTFTFKICIFIIMFMQCILIIDAKETNLYNKSVGSSSLDEMKEIWQSNIQPSIITYKKDEEKEKKYVYWKNSSNADNNLKIYLNNLNIKNNYNDIRLSINYITGNSSVNVVKVSSLEVYAQTENSKYGPFYMDYYEPTGFLVYVNGSSKIYGREFEIVTQNIKVPVGETISKIEIIPYGDYHFECNDGWRCGASKRFEVSSIKINGYDNKYTKPYYIITDKLTDDDVDNLRLNIMYNMYDLATIKWKPSKTMKPIASTSQGWKTISGQYLSTSYYYGVPYTQRNRASVSRFKSKLDSNGVYTVLEDESGDQSLDTIGNDCTSSVFLSYSKFIPLVFNADTADYVRNKTIFKLVDNLQMNQKDEIDSNIVFLKIVQKYEDAGNSEERSKELASQEIYKAYSKLKIGDFFVHYITGDVGQNHVAYVSGNARVKCNDGTDLSVDKSKKIPEIVGNCDDHGGINPEQSYFIRLDISSKPLKANESNNFEEDDVVASSNWKPNSNYTDINDIKDLNNFTENIVNFRINKKITFREALDVWYIPSTLKFYELKEIDRPYARIDNANTLNNIKTGLKGTILSNYPIESINFYIKDNNKGETKTFKEYPNHSYDKVESTFFGTYSLYYNTPQKIQDAIIDTTEKSDDYEIKITVDTGNKENIEVLNLKSKEVESIKLTQLPRKKIYELNEKEIDLSGGVITVKYLDNTEKNISLTDNKLKISGFDSKNIGKVFITIEYEGKKTNFEIEIVSKSSTQEVSVPDTKIKVFTVIYLMLCAIGIIIIFREKTLNK